MKRGVRMREVKDFNPYITYVNHGELQKKQNVAERMVMWYEIELITDAFPGGGCVTLDQFIPSEKGLVYIRKPGYVVRGIPPYSYTGILFDPFYDSAMESYYRQGVRCMLSPVDLPFLRQMNAQDRDFRFLLDLPPAIRVRDFEALRALFLESASLYISQIDDYQFYAKALLLQILAILRRETGALTRGAREKSGAVADAQNYMDAHYMEPVTLETLARRASMSREHFCRMFKKHIGKTPIQYLTQLRMFHAKHFLIMDRESMEEIAARCGFPNVNYFYMVFKKNTGTTPALYRRGAEAGAESGGRGKNVDF